MQLFSKEYAEVITGHITKKITSFSKKKKILFFKKKKNC